jgi:hypothetical protein
MTVTIRIERADGQFTVAQTEVPDEPPAPGSYELGAVAGEISGGFVTAYQRCAELPR